jgi:oligoribonuclease NrnB/cAMP/cGMP phosphodiesterase (DHH superfamily)
MKEKVPISPKMLPKEASVKVLTDVEDVDGVVCAALILIRFPNAIIETGSAKGGGMSGKYDIIVDLPLERALETYAWVDHHFSTVQEGKSEEKVYDPSAKSAAGLLARYLGIEASELAEIANRADSVSYLTDAPLELKGDYDPAWDVNDAVKAISSSERFLELAKTLATEGPAGVMKNYEAEISHTRGLRRMAEGVVQTVAKKIEEQKSDSLILFMPPVERRGSTVSGHIIFSLYRRGLIKASVVFYAGGCWLNTSKNFSGMDSSKIAKKYGGGGHRMSAGAPIGIEKLEDIKLELESAGLKPIVVDLRKQF